jgi:hypothetical protein
LKCGSDPKQERRRDKGNDVNADLMYKPPCEESNILIEEQTKNPERPSNLPLRSWLTSISMDSDGFKALAQHEEELVAVTQLENSTKTSQQKKRKNHTHTVSNNNPLC